MFGLFAPTRFASRCRSLPSPKASVTRVVIFFSSSVTALVSA